jgi:hypothetical protein
MSAIRPITSGHSGTQVVSLDDPGNGGAHHEYQIRYSGSEESNAAFAVSSIHFQNGPIGDVGINGCQLEDLLAIMIDRLKAFQEGPYRCDENARAINHLGDAAVALYERTADRKKRGVEGQYKQ